jgi:hypothetical protein
MEAWLGRSKEQEEEEMNTEECPCCGSTAWDFHYGMREEGHRFGGSEPDVGYCSACGFSYQEHIDHPMSEQVKRYQETDDYKKFAEAYVHEYKALMEMVYAFAAAMGVKLEAKLQDGYGGWNKSGKKITKNLEAKLKAHIKKGFDEKNMVDIGNLAAMIWWRRRKEQS